ncbi:glutamate--cysteine ligase regulatory subunit [Neocloeon triangulifer]|uniref:glutamate--cysteine ligase regulatory subunit n=1 Tax=Neocloeon triangulifer TaxID=2078957 RepID=UPI00286F940C|nr:glutamate--cysteine ligase regulatory subunit [Neocloeon triangulifer]
MIPQFSNETKHLIIHTGNILNLSEVKKKVGQNLTEEVTESLRITLNDWIASNGNLGSDTSVVEVRGKQCSLDVQEERKDLKIGLKMFLPVRAPTDVTMISSALSKLMKELDTPHVESFVLSQAGRQAEGIETEQQLSRLEPLWKQIEQELDSGRVLSAGVSDIDTESFVTLHNNAKVKPSIVQINLATCCVVPPALQAFTKENNVQLLTHNDPLDLLPDTTVSEIFGAGWRLGWVLRSQVHVKCRGVLASKGFIICVERE